MYCATKHFFQIFLSNYVEKLLCVDLKRLKKFHKKNIKFRLNFFDRKVLPTYGGSQRKNSILTKFNEDLQYVS